MSESHLDTIALELVRTGEGDPEEARHVLGCAKCRGELQTLRRLSAVLSTLPAPAIAISAARDRAILDATMRPPRRRRTWLGLVSAAAAAFVIALGLAHFDTTPTERAQSMDVDLDGVQDIVDAYKLAFLREKGMTDLRWDLNRDGVVDERDEKVIVREVVSVSRKGS